MNDSYNTEKLKNILFNTIKKFNKLCYYRVYINGRECNKHMNGERMSLTFDDNDQEIIVNKISGVE